MIKLGVRTANLLMSGNLNAKLRVLLGNSLVEVIKSYPAVQAQLKKLVKQIFSVNANQPFQVIYILCSFVKALKAEPDYCPFLIKYGWQQVENSQYPKEIIIQILVQIFAAFRSAFKNNVRLHISQGFFKLAFITLKVDASVELLHVNTLACLKLSCAQLKVQEWQQLFQQINQSLGKTENDFIQCRKIDLLQELIKNYKNYESLHKHIEKVIKYCLYVLSKMQIQEDSIGLLWDIVEQISDDPMLEFYASKLLFSSAKIFDNLLKQIVIRAFQQAGKVSKQGAKSLLLLCVFSKSIIDREDLSGGLLQIISNLQMQSQEFEYKTCALFFIYKFNPLIARLVGQQREVVANLLLKLIKDLELRQLSPSLKQLQYCCCHKLLQFGQKNKLLMQSQINQALGRLFSVYDKDFGDNIQKFIETFINNLQRQMCLVIGLVKHIVNLILQELVNSQKNQVVINIYWNALRFMADNPKLIVPAASEIQNCVLPLYQFMSDPKTIQFDEDICLFIGALIKATKRISQPQLKLFTLFPLIFNKYNKIFSFSYPCITLILGYGSDIIGRFPQAINLIIQLAQSNLKDSNKIDNIQTIFILQCLVLNLHPYLNAESANAILQIARNKLNSLNDCNSSCVESNLYGLIFLMILTNETKEQVKMKILNQQLNKQCLTKVSEWQQAKSVTLYALGTYMGQISNVLILKRILQIILDLFKLASTPLEDLDDDIVMEYNLSYELYKENRFDKFNEQIAIQSSIKKLFERKVIDKEWLTKNLHQKRFSKLEEIMGAHQTQAGVRRIVSVKK